MGDHTRSGDQERLDDISSGVDAVQDVIQSRCASLIPTKEQTSGGGEVRVGRRQHLTDA